MTPGAKKASLAAYQLKVTLLGSDPPIWRQFQVKSNTSLDMLHQVLQVVMGWEGGHLHAFTINDIKYGEPEFVPELEMKNERKAKLGQVATRVKETFFYLYDFGDSWEHAIEVEDILPLEKGKHYPVCLAGERACPPDDCGGIPGYYDYFLEAIRDPNHPEHEEMLDWIGGSFDPDAFDLAKVNQNLKGIR